MGILFFCRLCLDQLGPIIKRLITHVAGTQANLLKQKKVFT